MIQDLTVGKPSRVLLRYCLPLFASVIFQQLYNIADSFVAGRFVSEEALAAVGNSYEITMIFIAFAIGASMGCSVVISHLFGAKRLTDMKTAVNTAFVINGVLCIALMAVGLLLSNHILKWVQTPDNILSDSALYLKIYIYSLPFVFFYNTATGIFSSLGDSKTPFFFLMGSSLSNIGLDILFVTALRPVFPRGVDGVAWATFICQCVSCLLSLVVISKRLAAVKTPEKPKRFSKDLCKRIAVIAVPSILQQSFISVGNILVQSVINTFGSSIVAGFSAAFKLNGLVISSLYTFGNGVSYFSAQNLGANQTDRVRAGFRATLRIACILCVPLCILYLFFGDSLLGFFLSDKTGKAMEVGIQFLRIVSPFYFLVSFKLVADGVLRGAGNMKAFMISTFADLILRVVLSFVLSETLGPLGVLLSWPIGWIVGTSISLIFYRSGKWKDANVIGKQKSI